MWSLVKRIDSIREQETAIFAFAVIGKEAKSVEARELSWFVCYPPPYTLENHKD